MFGDNRISRSIGNQHWEIELRSESVGPVGLRPGMRFASRFVIANVWGEGSRVDLEVS